MNLSTRSKIEIALTVSALALIGGLFWYLHCAQATKIELHAPAIRQSDSSLVLERQATTPAAQVKVPHVLPRGTKLEREVNTTVTPTNGCPPVHTDISLIKLPDSTMRVVVSSPDGAVTGGMDIPVAPTPASKPHRWQVAAMYGYDTTTKAQVYGGQLSYQRGPISIGAGAIGHTVFASAGIHF